MSSPKCQPVGNFCVFDSASPSQLEADGASLGSGRGLGVSDPSLKLPSITVLGYKGSGSPLWKVTFALLLFNMEDREGALRQAVVSLPASTPSSSISSSAFLSSRDTDELGTAPAQDAPRSWENGPRPVSYLLCLFRVTTSLCTLESSVSWIRSIIVRFF